jgi:tripartite-type tricarboxylate transporter receptor subunit TctC
VASPAHLNAVMLSRSSGTPLEYVQYRGSAPMMADLVSGRLDLAMISYTVAKPFVEGKKLKILAQDSNERLSDMPEVPTMVEAGASGAKVSSWFGLAAPAGTPPAVVQKLNNELIKASKDPELVRRLRENGTLITTTSPDEMGRLMVVEAETVGPLVRSIGLTSQ